MVTDHVVLVDAQDTPVGTAEKMEAHRRGWLHRAFSIFVFDPEGRLLLQQRQHTKYHSGGLWSNTCCSHPRPDESLTEATRRRLVEEMGFSCTLDHAFGFQYQAHVDTVDGTGLVEHEYDHVFVGTVPAPPDVRPNTDEVSDWKWIDADALRADVEMRPQAYTAWFRLLVDRGVLDATPVG